MSLKLLKRAEHRANMTDDCIYGEGVVSRFASAASQHENSEVLRVAGFFRHWLRAYDSLAGRKVHGRRLTSAHPQRALEREYIRRIRHDFGHA